MVKAGERAANLTREMLAYSGKGRVVVERVDLSELVRDVTALFGTSASQPGDAPFEFTGGPAGR